MKLNKRKNVKRGIRFGVINQMVSLFLPFIVRTVIIKVLGLEYVGLKGLFGSILTVLNLTELGVGSAIVYSMYKPIAEDDYYTIGALLKLYKKLYRIIGLIVLVLGLIITPFLHLLIEGDYPKDINLRLIFLLYLCNTVLSYWVYAYKSSLLNAYQRYEIVSIIGTIIQILTCGFQIAFLFVTKNYYVFLSISIFFTVAKNIITSITVDNMYPSIRCDGKIQQNIKGDIKTSIAGLVIGKACGATRNTFDNIFMTKFLGLAQAGIYSNYYYILTALNGFTSILLGSLLGGVGNSIVTQSKQENYRQMMLLHSAYMIISGWMAICMLCLYHPFMQIWVGYKLSFSENIMILFPIYFYIEKLGDIRGVYADGAGLFWQNRYRTLVEAVANIILNYIFVLKWGAFGIMLATIITLFFIGFIGSTIVIFRYYFITGIKKYLFNSGFYMLITGVIGAFAYYLFLNVNVYSLFQQFVIRIVGCITIVPVMYLGMMSLSKDVRETYKWLYSLLK